LLRKIEYAGGNARSFAVAAEALARLAECPVSARHVERVTERLGHEREAARDAQAARMQSRKLRSAYKHAPAVAVVMLDAGKAQRRAAAAADDGGGGAGAGDGGDAGAGAAAAAAAIAGPGAHAPRWGDVKVACLQTYAGAAHAADPQPEPPAAFLDPPRVERLCREMERVRGTGGGRGDDDDDDKAKSKAGGAGKPEDEKRKAKKKKKKGRRRRASRRLVRTVVATTAGAEAFGWMASAEAMRRKFYAAPKRAVIGDGGNWIGPLADLHFPGWVQVLDFLHLLVHLFAAARLARAGDAGAAWALYERMLRDAWAGRVERVTATLAAELARLKGARAGAPDAWRVVELALAYVERNRARVDYPRYRTLGLPVSSALVESLIKQVNLRVKGTEQFWTRGGLEAVLQVRAAYLSQDDRAEAFHGQRPRPAAVGRNRARFLKAVG
jgi:hypothetical protein